jgi:eukaryotic-like serine/threonine-protein kinase
MPVVFHLSSWAVRRRPLADWLVDELNERYYVPRKLAQDWIDAEQVLLLLDGLDEVAPEHREECVEAINTFRRQHGLVPLAVCCRAADCQALPTRVELSGAVAIETLSRKQVGTYLKQAGRPLAGVRTALREDEMLWELLDTPLMLSIVALAYQGQSAAEVRATGSLEERRAHLFANYTERMFKHPLRQPPSTEYTREQTIRWLSWLARSLMHNSPSVFYVEWMQPNWLPSQMQQRFVAMIPIMVFGLVGGLVFGRVFGLAFGGVGGLVFGLAFGGVGGLVFGRVGGLVGGLAGRLVCGLICGLIFTQLGGLDNRITPVEMLRWSWTGAITVLSAGLLMGVFFWVFPRGGFWLIDWLMDWPAGASDFGPNFWLIGPIIGLIFGLAGGLDAGLRADLIVIKNNPE